MLSTRKRIVTVVALGLVACGSGSSSNSSGAGSSSGTSGASPSPVDSSSSGSSSSSSSSGGSGSSTSSSSSGGQQDGGQTADADAGPEQGDPTWIADLRLDQCGALGNADGTLFIAASRVVYALPKTGGAVRALTPPAAKDAYRGIAVGGGLVFTVDDVLADGIVQVPQSGGVPTTFVSLPTSAGHTLLSVGGSAVYWAYSDDTSKAAVVGSKPITGGSPTTLTTVANNSVSALTAYSGGYWFGLGSNPGVAVAHALLAPTALAAAEGASPPTLYVTTNEGNGWVDRGALADFSSSAIIAKGDVTKPLCAGAPCGDEFSAPLAASTRGVYFAGKYVDFSNKDAHGSPWQAAELFTLPTGATGTPMRLWRSTIDRTVVGYVTLDDTAVYWLVLFSDHCSVHGISG